MRNLIKKLQELKIRQVAVVSGVKIKATRAFSLSSAVCTSCLFDDGDGARSCKYRDVCMAHKRLDGESVIFKSEK